MTVNFSIGAEVDTYPGKTIGEGFNRRRERIVGGHHRHFHLDWMDDFTEQDAKEVVSSLVGDDVEMIAKLVFSLKQALDRRVCEGEGDERRDNP